jgi:hypothetical protein
MRTGYLLHRGITESPMKELLGQRTFKTRTGVQIQPQCKPLHIRRATGEHGGFRGRQRAVQPDFLSYKNYFIVDKLEIIA